MDNLRNTVIDVVDSFYQSIFFHPQSNTDDLLIALPTIIVIYNMLLCQRTDEAFQFQKLKGDEVEKRLIYELQMLGAEHDNYEEWIQSACDDIERFRSSAYTDASELICATTRALSSIKFIEKCTADEKYGGLFFERLIEVIFEHSRGIDAGSYNSPQVAKLISLLADSEDGMSLYDPTCGTGGFLLSSAKEKCCLLGQELNSRVWSMAKMNLFIHGYINNEIYLGDTLLDPRFSVGSFDRVVACPPFSRSLEDESKMSLDHQRFPFGLPQKKADYAFIQHALSSLNSTGRGVVVVSPSVLFSAGSDKKLRSKLVVSNVIRSVILLPAGLVYGSNISCAILILDNGRSDNDREIQFIDASNEYTVQSRQHILSENNISQIVSWYRSELPLQGKVSFKRIEEIAEADFDLTVSRYTFDNKAHEHRSIAVIRSEQSALYHELESLQRDMDQMLRDIQI